MLDKIYLIDWNNFKTKLIFIDNNNNNNGHYVIPTIITRIFPVGFFLKIFDQNFQCLFYLQRLHHFYCGLEYLQSA